MFNKYHLQTEKGLISLNLSLFAQLLNSSLFSKPISAGMRIDHYEITPDGFINIKNLLKLSDLRKKQLKIDKLD